MVMMRQLNGNLFPFVIQQRIEGEQLKTILSMSGEVVERWRPFGPRIAQQMQSFLDCEHVDLAFTNFIVSQNDHEVFYIDNKPPDISYKTNE